MLRGARQKFQPSVSLASLCRQMGLDGGYVASKRSDEARRLIRQFRRESSRRKAKREAVVAKDLVSRVGECFKRRVWPSYRRLRSMLDNPGSLRDPKLKRLRLKLISTEMERFGIIITGHWSLSDNFHKVCPKIAYAPLDTNELRIRSR